MASHRRTRLKELIDEYFTVIALVLVLLAAGGAWATYTTTVAPGSHPEQRVVSSWEISGNFEYSATAVNTTPIFDRGTVRAGQKFYFTNSMPVLDGQFTFGFYGATGNTTVTTQTTLVNYAISTQSGDVSQYGTQNQSERRIWQITTSLGTEQTQIEAGETATTTFSIDITDIQERVQTIGRALGPVSRVMDARTLVVISVHLNGTISGKHVSRSFNYTLPIDTAKGYYIIGTPQKPDTNQFEITRRVMVPNDYGPLVTLGSVAGLVAPLVALASLFYGRENDWFDVSPTAHAEAQRAKLRAEFEEWVTFGTVSEDDRTIITVDSLEGLVDVAIDSDRRVVEDDDTGTYVVIDDDVRYQFTPERSIETATEEDHTGDGFASDETDSDGDATENAAVSEDTDEDATDEDDGDAIEDTGVDVTMSVPAQSADGEDETDARESETDARESEADAQPTAVVDFADSRSDDDRENGTGSTHENTDDRSTDTDGVLEQLQSAVGSALGSSNGSDAEEASDDEPPLTDIHHVGESRAATLREAGFRTVADVREATPAELQEIGNIGATRAEEIRDSAEELAETTNESEHVSEEVSSADTSTTAEQQSDSEEEPNTQ